MKKAMQKAQGFLEWRMVPAPKEVISRSSNGSVKRTTRKTSFLRNGKMKKDMVKFRK
jgi:hypothetical protein